MLRDENGDIILKGFRVLYWFNLMGLKESRKIVNGDLYLLDNEDMFDNYNHIGSDERIKVYQSLKFNTILGVRYVDH